MARHIFAYANANGYHLDVLIPFGTKLSPIHAMNDHNDPDSCYE